MGYQPWYVGDTYPAWQIPLFVEGNADNITGLVAANFALTLRNIAANPPTDTTGTGTFSITTASPAVITYQPSAADVATAGTYQLYIKATWPGGLVSVYDPISFVISPS